MHAQQSTNHRAVKTTAIISSARDRDLATELCDVLTKAGYHTTVAIDLPATQADVVVAIMSDSALADQTWRSAVNSRTTDRIIPVAVESVDDEQVPEVLRPINWIHWKGDAASVGQLLAARSYSPKRYRIASQLSAEARAWSESGREPSRLVADAARLRELKSYLGDTEQGSLLAPDEATLDFVEQSIRASKRRRRNKRIRRWGFALVVVTVASVVVPGVIQERLERGRNRAMFATGDVLGLERDNAAWATMQTATVMIGGPEIARPLAEDRLRELVVAPAPSGRAVVSGFSFEGATTTQQGLALIALLGEASANDQLGIIDLRDSTIVWQFRLPGKYESVTVAPEGGLYAVAGGSGAAVMNFETEQAVELVRTGSYPCPLRGD